MREGQHQANLKITGDAKSADKEVQVLVKRIAELEAQVNKSNESIAKFEKRLLATKDPSGAFGKAMGFVKMEMMSTLGAIGVGGVVGGGVVAGLTILGSKMQEVAARTASTSQVFQTLKISIDDARIATEGIISNYDLAQKANELMVSDVRLTSERYAELARATIILGDAMGKTIPQAMESMTEAITKASAMRLDNLGVIVDEAKVIDEWAKANGKVVSAMDDVEKTQAKRDAFIQAIIDKSKEIDYNTKNTAGTIDRMVAAWENWKDNASAVATNNQNYLEKTRELIPEVAKLDRATIELLAKHKGIALQQTDQRKELEAAVSEIERMNGKYRTTEDLYSKMTTEAAKLLELEKQRLDSGETILANIRASTEEMQKQVRIAAEQQKQLLQVQIDALKDITAMRGLDAKNQEKATLAMISLSQEQRRIDASILSGEGKTIDAKKIRLQLQIEDLELERSRTKSQKEITALAKQEVELKAQLLEADGKMLEAMELRRTKAVADMTARTKEKVDPRAPFKQILMEAENAERLRAFGSRLEEIRKAELTKEHTHQAKLLEIRNAGALREYDIAEMRLEGERAFLEAHSGNFGQLTMLEERRIQLLYKREEMVRQSMEADLELREQFATRINDRDMLIEIQAEREEIQHQRMMARYQEQMELEQLVTDLERRQLEERAKQREKYANDVASNMQMAAQMSVQFAATIVDAGKRAKEAGENETKARRIAAGEALISISRQFVGHAIAHGIQAAASFATFNYAAGVQHTVAAGLYGAGAATLNITGRQLVSEGGGRGGGGVSVPKAGGPPPKVHGFDDRGSEGDVYSTPDSNLDTDTSGQRRKLDAEMASSRPSRGNVTININAAVVDDKVVREVMKRGKELQRTEGIEVPSTRRVGS